MIFFILFSNIPYIYLLTRYHAANGIIFSFSLVNITKYHHNYLAVYLFVSHDIYVMIKTVFRGN